MKEKTDAQLRAGESSSEAIDAQVADHAKRLVEAFVDLLEAHRGVFKQSRVFARCGMLAVGMIFAFSRHTVAQCVLSIGQGGRDWSAWYRLFTGKRFKQDDLDEVLLGEAFKHMPEEEPVVVAVDGTQTPHTSKDMPGCGLGISHRTPAYARGLHLCRRWVTCAWLPPLVDGITRAIPLKFLDAFTPKSEPSGVKPRKETEAAQEFLNWLRNSLDDYKRIGQMIVVLADGGFDTKEMWRLLPERCVLIVRTAKNRVLYDLPVGYLGRGRPRKYGRRAPTPDEQHRNQTGYKKISTNIRGRLKQMDFKIRGAFVRGDVPDRPVFLLVVNAYYWTSRTKKRSLRKRECKEAYYLISAVLRNGVWELPFPAELLLTWIWQRWEIEVTHRDMKAGFGIGQMQCWGMISSVIATRWCVWLFALMQLAAYRAWGWHAPFAIDCAWWRGTRRWSFNTVWRYFRIALWKLPTFRSVASEDPPSDLKIPAIWQKLWTSAIAAARA